LLGIERKQAAPQSLSGGVVCKELRWQSAVLNREGKMPRFKGKSAKATLAPNPSFERTAYSRLRRLPAAAQLER
jgi:hypothetical protein